MGCQPCHMGVYVGGSMYQKMGEYQLGRELSDEDIHAVGAWLKTLTGEIPHDYVRRPALP